MKKTLYAVLVMLLALWGRAIAIGPVITALPPGITPMATPGALPPAPIGLRLCWRDTAWPANQLQCGDGLITAGDTVLFVVNQQSGSPLPTTLSLMLDGALQGPFPITSTVIGGQTVGSVIGWPLPAGDYEVHVPGPDTNGYGPSNSVKITAQ